MVSRQPFLVFILFSIIRRKYYLLMDYGHWNYSEEFDPENFFGFVYLITNKDTQHKYIGKKQFKSKCNKIIKESNWKSYTSSSKEVNVDIKLFGKDAFTFEIIKLCPTKRELTESEVQEQFKADVLHALLENGEREYYNKSIMNKFFAHYDSHTEETKKKMAETKSGEKNPHFGKHPTEETRKKMTEAHNDKHLSEETKKKISNSMSGKKCGPYKKRISIDIPLAA